MLIHKIEPLKCPECNSTNVNRKPIINKRKVTNAIISCMECRKDYSENGDSPVEHKTRKFYGKSGVMASRCDMGDYLDHRGI